MKRKNGLFSEIVKIDNLLTAYRKAIRGKKGSYGVNHFKKSLGCNILLLHNSLASGSYKTGDYHIFKINEPKEREIYRLTFPHRVVHHAIMNVLEGIWTPIFTADTYSCIRGRGIHLAAKRVKKLIEKQADRTKYVLKLDVKKFYPSINHDILKGIIRRKIKCKSTLKVLDEIIDSAPGVPIGNYLSQFFANLYLAYLDHDIKEKFRVKHYFRYADDLVIFAENKSYLHHILGKIREKLAALKLAIKSNYQIFPLAKRALDFVGYVFHRTHTLLRKSIKQEFARKVAKGFGFGSKSWWAYYGWAIHCNAIHLLNKLKNYGKEKNLGNGVNDGDAVQLLAV